MLTNRLNKNFMPIGRNVRSGLYLPISINIKIILLHQSHGVDSDETPEK